MAEMIKICSLSEIFKTLETILQMLYGSFIIFSHFISELIVPWFNDQCQSGMNLMNLLNSYILLVIILVELKKPQ